MSNIRIIALSFVLFCFLGFVLRLNSMPTSPDRVDEKDEDIEFAHTVMSKKNKSVLWWLGKRAMEAVVSLAIGESVKYISDRTGLAEFFGLAEDHLGEIKRVEYINRDNRRAIGELREMCSYLKNEIIHTNKSLNEISDDFEDRFNNLDKKILRLSKELRPSGRSFLGFVFFLLGLTGH